MTGRVSPSGPASDGGARPYKIAVLCDLRDERGRVLLLHRLKEPNADLYSPIGGKLDTNTGESPAQCARREIQEEAGIDVPIERLELRGMISERGYRDEARDAGNDARTHWLIFYYRVLGTVEVEPVEMREGRLEWVDAASVASLPLPETDRRIIWPLVHEHEGGFFAVHIDCDGPELTWTVEQSVGRPG